MRRWWNTDADTDGYCDSYSHCHCYSNGHCYSNCYRDSYSD
jgi:hypothetical protein